MNAASSGAHPGREREAKFSVRSVGHIEQVLAGMGASLLEPRALEINLRLDDPNRSLRAQRRVLRLRQDANAWLTYKGPPEPGAGIVDRIELEVAVSDFDTARQILEALGFIRIAVYEKYRAVYEIGSCKVMLDELPYGNFIEIEGPNGQSIRDVADRLGIRWEAAVRTSYLGLWERYCLKSGLAPDLLTFAALEGMTISTEDLGVEHADGPDAGARGG